MPETGNGRWTRLYACLWLDLKRADVGKDAYIVYPYLQSCKHHNSVGLYYLPYGFLLGDLPFLSSASLSEAILSLIAKGFIRYDEEAELMYLPSFLDEQPIKNSSHCRKVVKEIEAILHSYKGHPYWNELLDNIPEHPYLEELRQVVAQVVGQGVPQHVGQVVEDDVGQDVPHKEEVISNKEEVKDEEPYGSYDKSLDEMDDNELLKTTFEACLKQPPEKLMPGVYSWAGLMRKQFSNNELRTILRDLALGKHSTFEQPNEIFAYARTALQRRHDSRRVKQPGKDNGNCSCQNGILEWWVRQEDGTWDKNPYQASCPDCEKGRSKKLKTPAEVRKVAKEKEMVITFDYNTVLGAAE